MHLLLFLLLAAPVAQATAAPPSLTQLLGRSRVVVHGNVEVVTPYDSGRISVARVHVERVLRGRPDTGSEVLVVERHDMPSSPDLMHAGDHVVALLVPATRTSSLRQALPAATYYELVEGRAGIVASTTTSEVQEAAALITRMLDTGRTPVPESQRVEASRKLVFDEIAAQHPRLVADGLAGLSGIRQLASTLSTQERQRLDTVLRRTDLPIWLRVALVNGVAERGLTDLVPTLQKLPQPTPELQRAAWNALIRLGQPPSMDDMRPALTSHDPAIRAAAAHELVAANGEAALPQVAEIALNDSDQAVRRAAIEALGESHLPAALPSLERAFASPEPDLRQAAGRSIVAVGGRQASETFARLAFVGQLDAQKYAVVMLLLSGVPHDDPLVEHIRTTHPNEEIRHVIEEGLDFHEH